MDSVVEVQTDSNEVFGQDAQVVQQVQKQPTMEISQMTPTIHLPDSVMQVLQGVTGVSVGDMGMKVSRIPIERYKASTQKVDLISFVTSQVIAVKYHYFKDKVGSVLCFGKKCCEMGGIPVVRYLFPVIVYNTDNEGSIVNSKLDIKILSAGDDLYKTIRIINSAAKPLGGIDNVDILVVCTDDTYQKITLTTSGPAKWKKSKQAVQYISERWAADAEFAYMAVARKMDESSFLSSMGLDVGVAGANQTFDGNKDLSSFFQD